MNLGMGIHILQKADIQDLEKALLRPDGQLALLKSEEYAQFPHNDLRLFCHKHARYGLPTVETVDFIKEIIGDRTAIEIGAGHGDLGLHLGIPRTDSKIQAEPQVRDFYLAMKQPIIDYPREYIYTMDFLKHHFSNGIKIVDGGAS